MVIETTSRAMTPQLGTWTESPKRAAETRHREIEGSQPVTDG